MMRSHLEGAPYDINDVLKSTGAHMLFRSLLYFQETAFCANLPIVDLIIEHTELLASSPFHMRRNNS